MIFVFYCLSNCIKKCKIKLTALFSTHKLSSLLHILFPLLCETSCYLSNKNNLILQIYAIVYIYTIYTTEKMQILTLFFYLINPVKLKCNYVAYMKFSKGRNKKGGNHGWLNKFGDFIEIWLIGCFIRYPNKIYRRSNFVYHHCGYTSIYWP